MAEPERLHPSDLLPLALGVAALAVGTIVGWDARLVDAVVSPPPIVRAALVGGSVIVGGWLFVGALRRIGAGAREGAVGRDAPDLPTMVRGVRLLFLAVAAFAAAVGWVAAHPLPIVIALIIAGIDVIETSFLLLVVRAQRGRPPGST